MDLWRSVRWVFCSGVEIQMLLKSVFEVGWHLLWYPKVRERIRNESAAWSQDTLQAGRTIQQSFLWFGWYYMPRKYTRMDECYSPSYRMISRSLPWAIDRLVKLPQRTMTFGMKLFSMQLSNIFRRPMKVSGLSSHTSDRKKKCRSASSFRTRTENWVYYSMLDYSMNDLRESTHIFWQQCRSFTQKIYMAIYWSGREFRECNWIQHTTYREVSRCSHGGWPIAMISSVASSVYSPSTNATQPSVNRPAPGSSYDTKIIQLWVEEGR